MNYRNSYRNGLAPIVIAIAVALGIATVGTAGMLAYKKFAEPVKTPDHIVSESFANLLSAKAFSYEAEMISGETGPLDGSLKLRGGFDFFKPESPKVLAILDVNATDRGNRIMAQIEARFIEAAIYAKLSGENLPKDGFFALVSTFANQWIKIDASGAGQFVDEEQANKTEDYIKKNKEARDIFAKHLKSKKFIIVESEVGKEEVAGASTTHYVITFDAIAISEAIPAIYKDLDKAGLIDSENKLDEADISRIKGNIAVEAGDMPKLDIWVETSRSTLRKIVFRPPTQNAGPNEGIFITFTDYNKPLEIEVPPGAKNLEEIFGQAFSNPGSGE